MSQAALIDSHPTAAGVLPPHVPASLAYDLDLFADPGIIARGHDRILDIVRETPPIFWTPRNGGHWVIRGHAAAFKAARDTESFSSEFVPFALIKARAAEATPDAPRLLSPIPINVDPPEHGKYRAPLNAAFSPKAVMALREDIRAHCAEMIEAVKPAGACEFMAAIAEPLPVGVFLRIFGLPLDRQRAYRDLAREHLASAGDPDPSGIQRRMQQIVDIVRDTLLERRASPRDDLISRLWQTDIDGEPMTLPTMENFAIVLFLGGLDTVMNGMGHGVRHLALNPALQDELRADPRRIPEAAEEILRRYTFTVPPRMVARDLTFEGVEMKRGERVFLFLPGADLDPQEFPDPARFDMHRENNVHIAFGAGPHRCVGSHLARVELQVLYEEMLERLPPFRLDPDQPLTFHGGHVIGIDALHLRWDAQA